MGVESSEPRARGVIWWGRALVLTLGVLGLGVLGHATAGGLLPGAPAMAALAVGTLLAAAALLRVRRTTPVVVSAMVAGQALVHLALSVTAGHTTGHVASRPPAPTVEAGGSALDRLSSAYTAADASYSAPLTEPARPLTGPLASVADLVAHLVADAPMMAVHASVAALLGWWLARGEEALWTLVLLAVAPLIALLHPPRPVLPRRSRTVPHGVLRTPPTLTFVASAVLRRGPPTALAV